jgi:diguanylate cyclase (GGDEF)-like protein/PAS domain S-box-containing protein
LKTSKIKIQPTPVDSNTKLTQQNKIGNDTLSGRLPINDSYLLNSLLDNVPEHIYFKDIENRFIRISKALADVFKLTDPAEAIGKTDYDYFSIEHARLAFEDEQEIIRTGRILNIEEKETWSDKPDTWVLTTKMPMYNENGEIVGTFGISRDITDRKIAEDSLRLQTIQLQNHIQEIYLLQEQLRDQATHDKLTGLSNRRLMDAVLPQQLSLCQQLGQSFTIMIIDIDCFKSINDEYGHPVGDAILEQFGKCILASTRSDDFCCRFGGDEILLAFQKMSIQRAAIKGDSIRKKLEAITILRENRQISVTVSIGIAAFPIHGSSISELIARADSALYTAKEKGRNQIALAE